MIPHWYFTTHSTLYRRLFKVVEEFANAWITQRNNWIAVACLLMHILNEVHVGVHRSKQSIEIDTGNFVAGTYIQFTTSSCGMVAGKRVTRAGRAWSLGKRKLNGNILSPTFWLTGVNWLGYFVGIRGNFRGRVQGECRHNWTSNRSSRMIWILNGRLAFYNNTVIFFLVLEHDLHCANWIIDDIKTILAQQRHFFFVIILSRLMSCT